MAAKINIVPYPPASRPDVPADTVVLYQWRREANCPSFSPLPIKLETYLRMAKIPYKADCTGVMSPKGKTPWISYKGRDMADSQLCINFLNRECGVDLSSHLSPAQRAIALAFRRMLEEATYWVAVHQQWRDGETFDFVEKIGFGFFRDAVNAQAQAQGTGRQTNEDADAIGERDFRAISDFLGDKAYLMGDDPCEEDATLFAFLVYTQLMMPQSPLQKLIDGDLKNLAGYIVRMKERYWPDWDQVCAGQ